MSWKGDLLKAGISSNGNDIDVFRGNLTVYGDIVLTGGASFTGGISFGSRTSGSGTDLGTYETGLLVAAQYEDAAAIANTTDYVGCASIHNLHMNRAVTLAAGGGYGWAGVWSNVELDKAFGSSGGLSAFWGTLWMDASGGDAAITGTCHLQVADFAIVTGSAFNLGAGTKLYGIRVDSSIHASITNNGTICGIIIEKSAGKLDWPVGIDINNATVGMDLGAGTDGIVISGAQTDCGIEIDGACADGIRIDGACSDNGVEIVGTCSDAAIQILTGASNYGIRIGQDCVTGMVQATGDSPLGVDLAGDYSTASIRITGTVGVGLHISGTATTDIQLQNGATIVNGTANTLTITEAIIDLTASTRIDLDGDVTLTGGLTFDGSSDITMRNGATIANASAGVLTLTEDGIWLVASGHNKIVFGGETDWGTGATGIDIDGTGYDWVTQTVGHVDSGSLAAACAAAYHALTVTATTHDSNSSYFGTWTELYFVADCVLTGSANAAAVWGQVEGAGAMTSPDSGDFVAGGYFNLKTGGLLTLTTGSAVTGCRVKGEIHSITGSGILAAFACEAVTTEWPYGMYMTNCERALYAATNPDGSSAMHAIDLAITDTTATTGGDAAGLHIGVTYSGDHSGTGWKTGIALDYQITGDNSYCFAQSIWMGDCGDAVIGSLDGLYIYMEDVGGSATVSQKNTLDLNIDNGDNVDPCSYIRLYDHSGSTMVDNVLYLPNAGHGGANFLMYVGASGGLVQVAAFSNDTIGTTAEDGYVRISIAGTEAKIPFWYDN